MGRKPQGTPGYDELIGQIIEDYRNGMSRRKLGTKYDLSTWTITDWLKRAEEPLRSGADQSRKHNAESTGEKKFKIPEDELKYFFLILGWTPERIGKVYGCSRDVIVDRVAEFKIARTTEQIELAKNISSDIRKETCREIYGGDSPNSDPAVRKKTAETNLLKYGSENPFASEQIQEEIRRVNKERHGYENPMQDPERASAVGSTVSEIRQSSWSQMARETLGSEGCLRDFIIRTGKNSITAISQNLKVSEEVCRNRVLRYGLQDLLDTSHHNSRWEIEVREFLKENGLSTKKVTNLLKGKQEIDIYSDDHKIGIECNGSRYHSEQYKNDRRYHSNKSQYAELNGIFLYHLFSYEWHNPRQRPIVESQLGNLFGLTSIKIGARKCKIVDVDSATATKFLDDNHMQGGGKKSRVKIGLEYQGILVALMTFSPPLSKSKEYQYELVRFAAKRNHSIPGGASRLFKHFVKMYDPKSIISFSEIAKTKGNLYSTLGFVLDGITPVDYVWWKNEKTIELRYNTSHKALAKRFPEQVDQIETEDQFMRLRGFCKIYRCGNRRHVWRKAN